MHTAEAPDAATVTAARAGDRRALEALVEGWMPLVYNIVGRALDGHVDVDDVVQETMLRVVHGLPGLQDPERFRSWLVAIAMRQVRERWRARQARPAAVLPDEAVDPGADFVDLSILRLGLAGQRQEVAEATRWLEPDERQLLSLWWLEAAGELTRAELSAALELTPPHTAVRVQRMKTRLDSARAVVRALRTTPTCLDLQAAASDWDGAPSVLWRKRLARHTRECPVCARHWGDMLPAEGLLVGLGLVPLPLGIVATKLLGGAGTGTGIITGAHTATGLIRRLVQALTAKSVAVAGVVTVAGGAAVVYTTVAPRTTVPVPEPKSTVVVTRTPFSPPPTSQPALRPRSSGPVYGQTVDRADAAPPPTERPRILAHRPQGRAVTMAGRYDPGSSDGSTYGMVHRGEQLTISGQGYFRIRWQVVYTERAGHLQMPSWTGLEGRLFHVASGGGHRMDDWIPGTTDQPPHTWMGDPRDGYAAPPAGAQQMWQNEFYYLDGTVTLHQNETGADYNLFALRVTRAQIIDDVDQSPSSPAHPVRYGLVRDTGKADAPVPQYLTRATPADPTTVPQHTKLS
jgi:RNA polymerase sigma factor (sigma-70 family)